MLALCGAAHAQGYSTPAEQRYSPYDANLPPCDDPGMLAWISSASSRKNRNTGIRSLQIGGYDRVREISFRGNGLGYIPRRYCVARAQLNDLKPHGVIYAIQEDLGIIGIGYGIECCMRRPRSQSRLCAGMQSLRPFAERFLGEKALREQF